MCGQDNPMPYSVPLSRRLKADGWKAKIRDRERLEPPHVTIMHRTSAWRLGLRDSQFLDTEPDPGDVPQEVLAHLEALRAAWDAMCPANPVR